MLGVLRSYLYALLSLSPAAPQPSKPLWWNRRLSCDLHRPILSDKGRNSGVLCLHHHPALTPLWVKITPSIVYFSLMWEKLGFCGAIVERFSTANAICGDRHVSFLLFSRPCKDAYPLFVLGFWWFLSKKFSKYAQSSYYRRFPQNVGFPRCLWVLIH